MVLFNSAGFVHGDIKLANFLVKDKGNYTYRVVLSDLEGMLCQGNKAACVATITHMPLSLLLQHGGHVLRKYSFPPNVQIEANQAQLVDLSIDRWSFGICLLEYYSSRAKETGRLRYLTGRFL
jgi:serine/threonine protein kinase